MALDLGILQPVAADSQHSRLATDSVKQQLHHLKDLLALYKGEHEAISKVLGQGKQPAGAGQHQDPAGSERATSQQATQLCSQSQVASLNNWADAPVAQSNGTPQSVRTRKANSDPAPVPPLHTDPQTDAQPAHAAQQSAEAASNDQTGPQPMEEDTAAATKPSEQSDDKQPSRPSSDIGQSQKSQDQAVSSSHEPSAPGNKADTAASPGTAVNQAQTEHATQVADEETMLASVSRQRFDGLPGAKQLIALECLASAITEQDLDSADALACLVGRKGRYLIRQATVLLGRNTDSKGEVDIDLSEASCDRKVSRRQAYLMMQGDGQWVVTNLGRKPLRVDGKAMQRYQQASIQQGSVLEVGELELLFLVNTAAVERVLRRTQRN